MKDLKQVCQELGCDYSQVESKKYHHHADVKLQSADSALDYTLVLFSDLLLFLGHNNLKFMVMCYKNLLAETSIENKRIRLICQSNLVLSSSAFNVSNLDKVQDQLTTEMNREIIDVYCDDSAFFELSVRLQAARKQYKKIANLNKQVKSSLVEISVSEPKTPPPLPIRKSKVDDKLQAMASSGRTMKRPSNIAIKRDSLQNCKIINLRESSTLESLPSSKDSSPLSLIGNDFEPKTPKVELKKSYDRSVIVARSDDFSSQIFNKSSLKNPCWSDESPSCKSEDIKVTFDVKEFEPKTPLEPINAFSRRPTLPQLKSEDTIKLLFSSMLTSTEESFDPYNLSTSVDDSNEETKDENEDSIEDSQDDGSLNTSTDSSEEKFNLNEENRQIYSAKMQMIEVFKEIYTTELNFVADLEILRNEFIEPLKDASDINHDLMNNENVMLIFKNVDDIYKINNELLNGLKQQLQLAFNENHTSVSKILDIFSGEFINLIPFFKIYSSYCHHYSNAIKSLLFLTENNRELRFFIQSKESKHQLESFLIKPVQRICKYPLLFRELLKYANKLSSMKDHSELINEDNLIRLKKASDDVNLIALTVNNKVSDNESKDMVIKVADELNDTSIIIPSRRFISKIQMNYKVQPFNETKRFKCRLYVFNDSLVIAKVNQSILNNFHIINKCNLKVLHKFPLNQCSVKLIKSPGRATKGSKHRAEYGIQLTRVERSTEDAGKRASKKWRNSMRRRSHDSVKVTSISKYEMWTGCHEVTNLKFYNELEIAINNYHNELYKLSEQQRKSISNTLVKKQRNWTSRRKDRKHQSLPAKAHQTSASEMSLTDIENRYSRGPPFRSGDVEQLTVVFNRGAMGFALENGHAKNGGSQGVVVACVQTNSVAEQNALRLGDRLVMINDIVLEDGVKWTEVVETIKMQIRPLKLTFQRVVKVDTAEDSDGMPPRKSSSLTHIARRTSLQDISTQSNESVTAA